MATIVELEKKIEKLERELTELRSRFTDESKSYVLREWERREVRKGLSDVIATDEEIGAVLEKYGLQNTL